MKTFLYILKNLILSLLCWVVFSSVEGQIKTNDLLLKSLQSEMKRNVDGLKMPNMPAPFFLSFIAAEGESIDITASLGAVVSSQHKPLVRGAWVRVLTESSKRSSDVRYNNQGTPIYLCLENNADQIRRELWIAADEDYKKSLEFLIMKKNTLRKMRLSPEEEALLDYLPSTAVTQLATPPPFVPYSQSVLEALCRNLSGVFKKYPQLFASEVTLTGQQGIYYQVTSEGSQTQQGLSHLLIEVTAKARTEDGAVLSDELSFCASNVSLLPTGEALMKAVEAFAAELQALSEAPALPEYYSGPVLFENAAVADIFINNLLTPSALISYRKPAVPAPSEVRNKPLGRKVIDTRLTVINHTQLKEYKGQALVGAYSVDAEAIVPSATQVLVEKGLLRQLLSSRIPNEVSSQANGNVRLGSNPAVIQTEVKPAVLEIQSSQSLSPQELHQRLLSSAKEEGLSYAYIVRKISGELRLFQIDVESGQERLVRSSDLEKIGIGRLKRFDAVSSAEYVENRMLASEYVSGKRGLSFPMSIICPAGLLLQDVEINRSTGNLEVKPLVKNPLER